MEYAKGFHDGLNSIRTMEPALRPCQQYTSRWPRIEKPYEWCDDLLAMSTVRACRNIMCVFTDDWSYYERINLGNKPLCFHGSGQNGTGTGGKGLNKSYEGAFSHAEVLFEDAGHAANNLDNLDGAICGEAVAFVSYENPAGVALHSIIVTYGGVNGSGKQWYIDYGYTQDDIIEDISKLTLVPEDDIMLYLNTLGVSLI